jgi:hypothetical protein
MKKLALIALVSIFCATAHAQLAGTKWRDTLKVDNPIVAIFDFGKDTLTVTAAEDGSLIEVMTYNVHEGAFTIVKVSGQSDCDNATPGKYHFEMKNGGMFVTLVQDACTDRAAVLDKTQFVKLN